MVERTTIEDKVDSRYVLGTPTNGTDLNLSDLVHGPRPSSQQPAHIPLPLRSATPHASTDGKPLQLRTKMIFNSFPALCSAHHMLIQRLMCEGRSPASYRLMATRKPTQQPYITYIIPSSLCSGVQNAANVAHVDRGECITIIGNVLQ